MKKAFTYMFTDNKFCIKSFLLLMFVILSMYCYPFVQTKSSNYLLLPILNYVIVILISLILYPVIDGYKISIIKSLSAESENISILPILNLKKDFFIGLKYLISLLIFVLPFFFVIGAFAFVLGFAPILSMPDILTKLAFVLFVLSVLIYVIYLNCFLPASVLIFAETDSIWSFYKFEEIFKLVSVNKKEYIKSAFTYFLYGIFINMCYSLCFVACKQHFIIFFIVLFVLACITTYLNFVMSYIIANLRKN